MVRINICAALGGPRERAALALHFAFYNFLPGSRHDKGDPGNGGGAYGAPVDSGGAVSLIRLLPITTILVYHKPWSQECVDSGGHPPKIIYSVDYKGEVEWKSSTPT